jgi:hypothetical protein
MYKRRWAMPAITLRMDDKLARQLDRVCREKGYKKNGLVLSLVRGFLKQEKEAKEQPSQSSHKVPGIEKLEGLVGIVSLGGDAVEDSENYWD